MNKYEIIYFDVDGTLLDNKNRVIPQSTLDALKTLKSKGYKLALCTGRNIAAIDIVKNIIDWDGYVLSNGCAVYDKDLNPIHLNHINEDFLKRLLLASDAPLFLEGDGIYVSKPPHQKLQNALDFFNEGEHIEFSLYDNQPIFNLMCYDYEDLNFDLLHDFDTHVLTYKDIMGNVEIVPQHSGKHVGCAILNKHLDVEHFLGFGDGENDIEFLRHATFSVAMGNAKSHIKAVADHITTDVSDNGIHVALKHLNLI